MSFPYTPDLQDEKIESLQTQREYLNLLRLRHLQWMTVADNPRAQDMHREIAGLLEKITDHYKRLLAARS
jgi:ribosomal protein L30/L7E